MPIEFHPSRPLRAPSSPKTNRRSADSIDRGPGKTAIPGKAPSARPDSHVLGLGGVEARREQAVEKEFCWRPKVPTADEIVEQELGAHRGWSPSTKAGNLADAESAVDRKIGQAVLRGDVARVAQLERRKDAIDNEEFELAEKKMLRQREEVERKVRAQITQDHVREIRADAAAKEAAGRAKRKAPPGT